MKNYQNILVVRTDRIGDVILTMPAIHALRRAFPDSRISILVSSATRDLVDGNPDLDEIIVDDRKKVNRGAAGFFRLVNLLRKKKFDLAINYHTKKRTNVLCFFAGIPNRIGYCNEKFGFLLTHKVIDSRPQGIKHEAEYCLEVLKVIGVNDAGLEVFIPAKKEAEEWARQWLAENQPAGDKRIFAIHPGASCPTKKWPAKRFAELINELIPKYNCNMVIIGTEDNKDTVAEILASVKGLVFDLTGKTSVSQLAGLLRRCQLLVSNDSGPVHIAAGVGTPVVSIFTRNQPGINPERWKPLGAKSCVVTTPFAGNMSFAKGEVADASYLEMIKIEDVLEAVAKLLKH